MNRHEHSHFTNLIVHSHKTSWEFLGASLSIWSVVNQMTNSIVCNRYPRDKRLHPVLNLLFPRVDKNDVIQCGSQSNWRTEPQSTVRTSIVHDGTKGNSEHCLSTIINNTRFFLFSLPGGSSSRILGNPGGMGLCGFKHELCYHTVQKQTEATRTTLYAGYTVALTDQLHGSIAKVNLASSGWPKDNTIIIMSCLCLRFL